MHEEVFAFVLGIAQLKKLLKGQTVGVDATLLEANAALKSIVRKDTGEDYRQYLRRLAKEAGIEDPSDDDLKKFDKRRKGKKLSNADWESPTEPDGRIAKMKDGTTHIAHKAEHAVDLESELLLAATVQPGDAGDPESLPQTLVAAQVNLMRAGSDAGTPRSGDGQRVSQQRDVDAMCRVGHPYVHQREGRVAAARVD